MEQSPHQKVLKDTSTCFLNNDFLPLKDAKVSVLDRGFIFADGIYEVIPAFAGKPFRLEHHLNRLNDNLTAVKIENPFTADQWQQIFTDLIDKNNYQNTDYSIYMQVTRGVAKRDHVFPENSTPTIFAMLNPMPSADPKKLEEGLSVITREDIRWQYCNIKSISLLGNIILKQEAADNDADEAVLIRDGHLTEGSSSNIFIVKNGVIKTPIKNHQLLPGITRDLIVEIANDKGLACEETTITEEELLNADEVWLSSSLKEVSPVCVINNKTVADGLPGPYWRKMYQLFQDYKAILKQQ